MVVRNTKTHSRSSRAPADTRIVGVGASAGGLNALEQFFAQLATDTGLAYVVVQHMDPAHKAMLGTLLQRVTTLPVQDAEEGMQIMPNNVYVIPPAHQITVAQGQLHLTPTPTSVRVRLPIDLLFRSLAQEYGPQAIGVVLSGMGSDGTLGLQAIHESGGLTLAQKPDSAQFDAMPRSAIASGWVALVDTPDKLPGLILGRAQRATEQGAAVADQGSKDDWRGRSAVAVGAHAGNPLDEVLRLLHDHCKHDLSLYKPSTLMRRIERRVAVHGLASVQAYAELLRGNPKELDLLFAEMLIGVTEFFRDSAVWLELEQVVWPRFLQRHLDNPEVLRAWVVGCSTGEEAYSLAMCFLDARRALANQGATQPQSKLLKPTLQIFATDLSAEAVAVARRGWYSAKALETMDPERRARYFTPQEGGYQIGKLVREMVLFAQHDVTQDPPFTRLDLLSCRNVLIYFKAALQNRLMPLFHFSLRPNGVLLLGGSETVGRIQSLFSPLQLKSRLFQRNEQPAGARHIDFPTHRHTLWRTSAQEPLLSPTSQSGSSLQALADQLLLQTFSPPAVLVNAEGDILYISGRTGRFLEPVAGKANWNIHVMARPGLRTHLSVALRHALRDRTTVELAGLTLEDDATRRIDVTVQALKDPRALEGMALVVFREGETKPGPQTGAVLAADATAALPADERNIALVQALERANTEIQALRLEMQLSRESQEAANEELQTANEELQSANEELTTSKEEAQSMNEELQTINGELQIKLDDLALAQSDMQNLLNSTDIATLFLDNARNVRRFTEQACTIFHLRDSDVGRPLSDLASTLDYPQLHDDVQDTLRTLATSTRQIPTTDGRWFSVRIMPYRTLSNMIQGAVLTFVDISKSKELEFQLREGFRKTE